MASTCVIHLEQTVSGCPTSLGAEMVRQTHRGDPTLDKPSRRPVIDLGEPILKNIPVPPRTREELQQRLSEFPSEHLCERKIRRGWWLELDETLPMPKLSEIFHPQRLDELMRRLRNSEPLKALRRKAHETAREVKRAPTHGKRDDEEYGNGINDDQIAEMKVPDLVHAAPEEMTNFFVDLAGDVELDLLVRRVPHGVRRRKLFETLHEHGVSMRRAMWFVKINYLSQCKKDVAKCRKMWTEDLLAHLLDTLSYGIASQMELRYVIALVVYSIEEDLLDQKMVLFETIKFLQEKFTSRHREEEKVIALLRVMGPLLQALVPDVAASNADTLRFANVLAQSLNAITQKETADKAHIAATLSDILSSLAAANLDAFVAAPRNEGLHAVRSVQDSETKSALSSRLHRILNNEQLAVQALTRMANPELIAIKVYSLVELLHSMQESMDSDSSVAQMAREFISKHLVEENMCRAAIKVVCGWSVATTSDCATSRQNVACAFLQELCSCTLTVSSDVLDWIKFKTIELTDDHTDLLSSLFVRLLDLDIISISKLFDFIIAEGIMELKDSPSSQKLMMKFRVYVGDILKKYEEKGGTLDDTFFLIHKQLLNMLESSHEAVTTFTNPSPTSAASTINIVDELDKRIFDLLSSVTIGDLLSNSQSLKVAYEQLDAGADKAMSRVVILVLTSKPAQVPLVAEMIGTLGETAVRAMIRFLNLEVLAVDRGEAKDDFFAGGYWKDCDAAARWKIAKSLAEMQLCLLHNIPKGKRAIAEEMIEATLTQLSSLGTSKPIQHFRLHVWLRLSLLIPLIGYVFMSTKLSEELSRLIVSTLDSFTGATKIEESEEDLAAEAETGQTLIDCLVALFAVIWNGQVPCWAPVLLKLPFRDVSSLRHELKRLISSTDIDGTVQLRLRRAIGVQSAASVEKMNPWRMLATGTSITGKRNSEREKAASWLKGAVRQPGGNLAWENVFVEPQAEACTEK